jgi:cytochrome c553
MSRRALLRAIIFGIVLLSTSAAQVRSDAVRAEKSGLAELMVGIQLRHIKLWFAGKFGNWKLAAYELDQIEANLAEAANRSSSALDLPSARVQSLRSAIQAADAASFTAAYSELTRGCNTCHRVTGHAFIAVQTPASSPFSDQIFYDQVAEGRALARRSCGTCHVVENLEEVAAVKLPAPSFAELVRRPAMTEEALRGLLASDHRRLGPNQAMPNPRLSQYQIEDIVAFFNSLRTNR